MDKVVLYDDERLDIPDIQDIQRFPYQYLERALAGVMGAFSGTLLNPNTVFNVTLKTITLQRSALFYQSHTNLNAAGGTVVQEGRVIRYDPDLPYQNEVTASYEQAVIDSGVDEPSMHLWAKRGYVKSDSADRRYWDPATGTEFIDKRDTIDHEIIENLYWQSEQSNPPYAGAVDPDWFIVATVQAGWGGGAGPEDTFKFLSVFDELPSFTKLDSASPTNGDEAAILFEGAPLTHGISGHLVKVRQQIQALIDGTLNATWVDTVKDPVTNANIGVKQLLEKIEDLNALIEVVEQIVVEKSAVIPNLEARIAILEATQVVAHGYIVHENGVYKLKVSDGFKKITTVTAIEGKYILELDDHHRAHSALVCPVGAPAGAPFAWIDEIVWLSLGGGDYGFTTFSVNNAVSADTTANPGNIDLANHDNFVIVVGYKPTIATP